MGFFGSLFGGKGKSSSGMSPEIELIFEKLARLINDEDLQNSMYPLAVKNQIISGPAVDELPYGIGEFGQSEENPIPVNGAIGELIYLSSLKTQDGDQRLLFHRLGSVDGVDIYETVSIDGHTWDILFFSMYHPRKSHKAPSGYSIASTKEQTLLYGTNQRVKKFPYGLQKAIKVTTSEILGIPITPPQIRQAEENIKFQRPHDHENRCRSLITSVSGFRSS
jgi:hypothetical protein